MSTPEALEALRVVHELLDDDNLDRMQVDVAEGGFLAPYPPRHGEPSRREDLGRLHAVFTAAEGA